MKNSEISGGGGALPLRAIDVRRMIPPRPRDSQKGKNGHVLLIAGSRAMGGAAVLSALGALRVGAGLVTVGIVESSRRILVGRVPEVMALPLPETKDGFLSSSAARLIRDYVRPDSELAALCRGTPLHPRGPCVSGPQGPVPSKNGIPGPKGWPGRRRTITTLAVGPGLGKGTPQKNLVLELMSTGLPIVLDADALNNLSSTIFRRKSHVGMTTKVITPHPGELARLLGTSTEKVQENRQAIAEKTARNLGVVCVLKGHGTVISDGRQTFINPTGNPAMAAGGMGDVLTGVIAGLLAQGLSLFEAACAGVYLHGLAGDLARVSDRGLLATELAAKVPYALKKVGMG